VTRPVHVILNPAAGGGSGRRARAELERELAHLDIAYTLEETTGPGHATELAYAAALGGTGTLIAAGGDGTLHEVANGLLRARAITGGVLPTLAVVPIGTGNDFVKVVNGATDREHAYQTLAHGVVRHFDVGRVEWEGGSEYFINGSGTGIDVEVVRQIKRMPRLPGVLSYLLALLKALLRFRPIPLWIRADGVEYERRVMMIAITNGASVGGGFYLSPSAVPDDGQLDLCMVNELSYPQIARVLPRILRGTHGCHPEVTLRRVSTVEVHARGPSPLFFQLDGELREPEGARFLRIEVERGVLPVLAAPTAPAPRSACGEAAGTAQMLAGSPR
jgi:YegS/Rv2252/BmrU family lipid kinase